MARAGHARLTEADVHAYVARICFKTGPPGRVGAELEWLVHDARSPRLHVPLTRLATALEEAGDPPAGSRLSFEPGGQLELSSLPCHGVSSCVSALRADLSHLHPHLTRHRLRLAGHGLDPERPPVRQLDVPRYAAMEAFFDARGGDGRVMMCSTAAVQVCVDIGHDPVDSARRWRLAHALGPVLVAAFANSPLRGGRPTGWRSTRQAVWFAIDPGRTLAAGGGDPVETWARYALDAAVMLVRRDGDGWLADPGVTFREWLRGAREYGHPVEDDLAYHLTTLFPPVRPRGCLELRMIDAQSPSWWPVPAAVVAALVDDPRASEVAMAACEPVAGRWREAARDALTDPPLALAARVCFEAALDALPRLGVSAELTATVERFVRRYAARGRCPADDVLDGRSITHEEVQL